MSIPVKYYVNEKLKDVVRLSSVWHEESGGYQTETTTEIVVCPTNGGFAKFEGTLIQGFGPRGGPPDFSLKESGAATKEEYNRLRAKHGILDDSTYWAGVAKAKKLDSDYESLRPKCPKCTSEMVQRTGPRGDFYGCSKYSVSKCNGTKPFDPALAAQLGKILNERAKYER